MSKIYKEELTHKIQNKISAKLPHFYVHIGFALIFFLTQIFLSNCQMCLIIDKDPDWQIYSC